MIRGGTGSRTRHHQCYGFGIRSTLYRSELNRDPCSFRLVDFLDMHRCGDNLPLQAYCR